MADALLTEEGRAPGALLTTAAVPAQRRRTYWRDALSQTFGAVDITVPREVRSGTIRTAPLGSVQVITVDSEPQDARRSRRMIARGGEDAYVVVKLLTRGAARIEQDSRDAAVRPGEVFVYDMARPVRLTLPRSFQTKSVVLPRQLLGLDESDVQRITASPLRPDQALGGLLSVLLSGLADNAASYRPHTGELLARNVADLLTVLAGERAGRPPQQSPSGDATTVLRIKAFIGRHLADPGLTPEAVARAHHISVRYLHKLFESEDTTVSRWIRGRRLEACRKELTGRRAADTTIAAVAHRWGFANAAHFSRVFRAAYGMTPTQWRDLHRLQPTQPPQPPQPPQPSRDEQLTEADRGRRGRRT